MRWLILPGALCSQGVTARLISSTIPKAVDVRLLRHAAVPVLWLADVQVFVS